MSLKSLTGLILLGVLGIVWYSILDATPNDHHVSMVPWYTLVVLRDIAQIFGLGGNIQSVTVVARMFSVFVVLYAIGTFMMPSLTDVTRAEIAQTVTDVRRALRPRQAGVLAIAVAGLVTCIAIIFIATHIG